MHSRQRYVVIGVLGLAVLISIVLSHGFEWLWLQFGWENKIFLGLRDLHITNVIAGGIGLALAIFCLKYKVTSQLATEVVDELAKVSWPSREETARATWVVIVTVLICSAYLGLFDAFWLWVTDWMMGIQRGTGQ